MNLKNQIDRDIKSALLQQKKQELTALRAIKAMILLAESEKGQTGAIDRATEIKLLVKAAKQRQEAAELFKKEDREALYQKEIFEFDIINRYLPKPCSPDELHAEIKKIIEQVGAGSPRDMGKVMALATKQLLGRADGKTISETVKTLLSS